MWERETLTQLAIATLSARRDTLKAQWAKPQGTQTRHLVVDDLFPKEVASAAYEAFPQTGDGFADRNSFREKKRTSAHLDAHHPLLGDITYALQDPRLVALVGEITGMDKLEPDPKLYAGGLSMMFNGDFLNPHIDNSHDSERSRYRRLNLLYYVSPEWALDNGGNFELWNDDQSEPVTLVCLQNRLVVMETNKSSWHSVSPVKVERARCCISNYYFSQVSPDESDYYHVTSFTGRPQERIKRLISTVDNGARQLTRMVLGKNRDA